MIYTSMMKFSQHDFYGSSIEDSEIGGADIGWFNSTRMTSLEKLFFFEIKIAGSERFLVNYTIFQLT